MVRFVVIAVLIIVLVRAASLLLRGLGAGIAGASRSPESKPAVQMVRDPVCGTFVVPDHSITLSHGQRQLHFCSTICRDTYRARPS